MQEGTFSSHGHCRETVARGDVFAADCPTRRLLDRIADKWSTLILLTLHDAPMRFNGLKRRIEGVSQKMLSQTLRSLERDGLVSRKVVATVPVSVTYAITPLGASLVASLRAMIDWAETRMPEVAAAQAAYDAGPREMGDA
ncbi:helix-turn-helix domain-containing protein [uncultured Methylobacterium sp.]|jgi:DNA-binding HxlR family transcriptional regulator|uniref:winged helix-turn-helix transcriptional regulator n=1 Tax=uncultured Methylobacterium sp. TaxID=157278 RepID=UPI00260CA707|nr:helix-turn-helix domain-containing protein [uncultured Methylobacterium sp.]